MKKPNQDVTTGDASKPLFPASPAKTDNANIATEPVDGRIRLFKGPPPPKGDGPNATGHEIRDHVAPAPETEIAPPPESETAPAPPPAPPTDDSLDDSPDDVYIESRRHLYDENPQPQSQPPRQTQPQQEGAMDVVKSLPGQIGGGVRDAVVESGTAINQGMNWIRDNSETLKDIDKFLTDKLMGGPVRVNIPEVQHAGGPVGEVVRRISQGAIALIPASKAVGGLNSITKAMAAQALVEGIAFNPREPGFFNMVSAISSGHPELQSAIDTYLASNPEDSIATAKLKKALEGAGMVAGIEGILKSFKLLNKAGAFKVLQNERGAVGPKKPTPAAVPKTPTFINIEGQPVDIGGLSIDWGKIKTLGNLESAKVDIHKILSGEIAAGNPAREFNDIVSSVVTMIGKDFPETLQKALARNPKAIFDNLIKQQLATRILQASSVLEQVRLARIFEITKSPEDSMAFMRQFAITKALGTHNKEFSSGFSTGLATRRIDVPGSFPPGMSNEMINNLNTIPELLKNDLAEMAGAKITPEELIKRFSSLSDQAEREFFMNQAAKRPNFWAYLLEYYYFSLLSSTSTLITNFLGSPLLVMLNVIERYAAGAGRKVAGQFGADEGVSLSEATAYVYGMAKAIPDGLLLLRKAWKTGKPSGQFSNPESYTYTWTAENLQLNPGSWPGVLVDLFGTMLRLPGRGLMSVDELYKYMGYKAELTALATRKALSENRIGEDLAKRIQQIIDAPPPLLQKNAKVAGDKAAFSNSLTGLMGTFKKATNEHLYLKFGAPFLTVPINILKEFFERTPLALFLSSTRARIAKGGADGDLALAKVITGSALSFYFYQLALDGKITGGGPRDAAQKEALLRTGWRPYSLVLANKAGEKVYYGLSRLDPIATFLSVAGDLAEIVNESESGDLDEQTSEEIEKTMEKYALVVAKNITQKSSLMGLMGAMEALALKPGAGESFSKQFAASLVPAVSGQVAKLVDPDLRYITDITSAMKSKIPGLSSSLPPKLDLWGEKVPPHIMANVILPVFKSVGEKDKAYNINTEIVRLEMALKKPGKTIDGIELTPTQHNRLAELAGKPAKIQLDESIKTDEYKNASDQMKILMIGKVITMYRQSARKQMFVEFPDLDKTRIARRQFYEESLKPPNKEAQQ